MFWTTVSLGITSGTCQTIKYWQHFKAGNPQSDISPGLGLFWQFDHSDLAGNVPDTPPTHHAES